MLITLDIKSQIHFERFADGDSTMGRDGHQQHALEHILSYLNLSLKGVDDAYAAAFNREDKSVSSDSEAYIDENLDRSRLYKMDNITSDKPSVMLNQSFTLSAEVTMRDGTQAFGKCVAYRRMEGWFWQLIETLHPAR